MQDSAEKRIIFAKRLRCEFSAFPFIQGQRDQGARTELSVLGVHYALQFPLPTLRERLLHTKSRERHASGRFPCCAGHYTPES